jgi:predicted flap endonuclease-1-like 5' DNA nuclease
LWHNKGTYTPQFFGAKNGRVAVPAQDKLSFNEQIMAYVAGAGIALAIVALFLMGLGSVSDNLSISLLIVGLALVVLGVAGWLYFVRPWQNFDDLKTPHFTRHDEHAHAEPVAEPEPEIVVSAAPVMAVPPEPAAPTVAVIEPAPTPVAAVEPAPVPVMAAAAPEAPAQPDDLTLIEGIGPKSAAALVAMGISTFAQVAAKTPEELETAVKAQKVRLVGSTATWPTQARLAAVGELTALEDFQKRIKSGGKAYDDLTSIEGVGPKVQQALYQAGVLTFGDLAGTTVEQLRGILAGAGLQNVSMDRWPEQAALAAGHDLTGLKKMQDNL